MHRRTLVRKPAPGTTSNGLLHPLKFRRGRRHHAGAFADIVLQTVREQMMVTRAMLRRPWPRRALVVLVLASLLGCWRDSGGVALSAPFNDDTEIGRVTAVWENTGEERAFADATRLNEPEVRFQYRVDVKSDMDGAMFVRLGSFQLLSKDGLALGRDDSKVECVVGARGAPGALSGSVWVGKGSADRVASFQIGHFAVPLNDRGRALYRESQLVTRPGEAQAIDAEIAGYAGAKGCGEK
jgi:hypothetical protein